MNLIKTNLKTMSSREIASITGKRHSDVLRDIRKMLKDLEINERNFASVYLAGNNEEKPQFDLNKNLSITLVSGYSVSMRFAIIEKWQELEAQQPTEVPTDFISAMRLSLNQAVMLQEQAPKVEYHDKVLSSKNGMTTTEVAAQAGMSAQKLNKLLQTLHVQKHIGNRWVLTVPHLGQGLAK